MNKGIKSSEFWLTVAALVVNLLLASGAVTSEPILVGLGIASSTLASLGYAGARTLTKTAEAKKEAVVATSLFNGSNAAMELQPIKKP